MADPRLSQRFQGKFGYKKKTEGAERQANFRQRQGSVLGATWGICQNTNEQVKENTQKTKELAEKLEQLELGQNHLSHQLVSIAGHLTHLDAKTTEILVNMDHLLGPVAGGQFQGDGSKDVKVEDKFEAKADSESEEEKRNRLAKAGHTPKELKHVEWSTEVPGACGDLCASSSDESDCFSFGRLTDNDDSETERLLRTAKIWKRPKL